MVLGPHPQPYGMTVLGTKTKETFILVLHSYAWNKQESLNLCKVVFKI